jgi:hypothetical protein
VKGDGAIYISLASRPHPVPWISTAIPFRGFRRLIEIVPRCPGSKPGSVAAVSLATDTTTPMLAWFSTSNVKVVGDAVGGFGGGRNGGVLVAGVAATVAVGREVGGCEVGLGVGAHAQSVIRSAANARRIFCLAAMCRRGRRWDGAYRSSVTTRALEDGHRTELTSVSVRLKVHRAVVAQRAGMSLEGTAANEDLGLESSEPDASLLAIARKRRRLLDCSGVRRSEPRAAQALSDLHRG